MTHARIGILVGAASLVSDLIASAVLLMRDNERAHQRHLPEIVVEATYAGANAAIVQDTVAVPPAIRA